MKKLIAIFLVLVLALSLVACGGKSENGKGGKDDGGKVKGEQQTWGQISVLVPDGYELKGGDMTGLDETDETQCSIQPKEISFYDYYWIMVTDADTAANNVDFSKDINSGEDVTVSAGGHDWKGFTYSFDGLDGAISAGTVYSEVDGVVYQVNFCGHAADSPELAAVLESIKAA